MDGDWNGWGPRAWDQMTKRIDALEDAVNKLAGRPPDAPKANEQEVKVGGLGLGTLILILGTISVPIVVAIIMTQGG